jgi:hypothetical protein
MRVKAPGGPGDGPPSIDAVAEVDRAAPAEGARPADAVEKAGAIEGAAATEGAEGIDRVDDIARRLRAGSISAAEAVELLIDDVVTRSAGPALGGVPAEREALAEELKQLLRRQAEADPFLAARVKRLGGRS